MKKFYVPLILFLIFSVPATAGQKVLFTGDGSGHMQSMAFEYLDENAIRMEAGSQPKAYTLFRNHKVYLVSNANGQPMVMDMASLGKMSDRMGLSQVSQPMKVLDMSPTGQKEQVAGINGEVYQIVWRDDKGTLHDDSLVLSRDPRAKEWTTMWIKATKQLQSILSNQPANSNFEELINQEGKGLLRLGSTLVVTSLEASNDPHQFELPAQPISLPDFSAGIPDGLAESPAVRDMPKGMPPPHSSVPSTSPSEPQNSPQGGQQKSIYDGVAEKVERQKKRQEDKIDSRVDETVDETVDSAVDKTMDKIFEGIQSLFD